MKLGNIKRAIKYGLILDRIFLRLKVLGITVLPYYIFEEGEHHLQIQISSELYAICHCKFLGKDDMAVVAQLDDTDNEEQLLNRLDIGHLCYGLFVEDKLVAYMWCDLKEFNHQPYRHLLRRNEAYLYDARVDPGWRGKNLAPFFRHEFYRALKQYSKDTFLSYSDYTNTPAIRFKKKLGARFLKFCLYLNLWGRYSRNWILHEYSPQQSNKPIISGTRNP